MYRLLIDLEVYEELATLRPIQRRELAALFGRIREFPYQYSAKTRPDEVGRNIDIAVIPSFEIHYWIDEADRHVKVMQLKRVRSRRRP